MIVPLWYFEGHMTIYFYRQEWCVNRVVTLMQRHLMLYSSTSFINVTWDPSAISGAHHGYIIPLLILYAVLLPAS